MSDKMNSLVRCPFCKTDGKYLTTVTDDNKAWVSCFECGCRGPLAIDTSYGDKAVKFAQILWNNASSNAENDEN
jgi:transcription elongation factor Elf1